MSDLTNRDKNKIKHKVLEQIESLEKKIQEAKTALDTNDYFTAKELFTYQTEIRKLVEDIGFDCTTLFQRTCEHPSDQEINFNNKHNTCQCMACQKIFPFGKPLEFRTFLKKKEKEK